MNSWKPLILIIAFLITFSGQHVFAKAMTNADFNGRYIVGHAIMDDNDGYITDVLQFEANGSGKITYSTLYTTDSHGNASGTLTYSVGTDGKITIIEDSKSSLAGVLSQDGQYFTLTHSGNNVEPLLMFGIKESSGMNNTKLSGYYDLYGLLYESNELQTGASFLMSFNGKGHWEIELDEDGAYSVNSKGHVSLESHYGMVSGTGDVVFLVTIDDDLDVIEIIVGVRRTSGMNASNLLGNYYYAEIGTDAPRRADDFFYTFSAGKNNAYTFQGLTNSCGCPLASGSGFYSVESNGSLSFIGDAMSIGSLSADGHVMAITGLDDDYVYFGIGILNSATSSGGTGSDGDDSDDDGDGYTETDGDCNDNNKAIHPGAIDTCDDGIDQDCDGKDESCMDAASAPTGVEASDDKVSGKIRVTWNAASGAASYDIFRADMPAWTGTSPKRIAASVTDTTYDDKTAAESSRYYYWVKSRNAGGVSKYSNFDPGYWGSQGTIPAIPTNVSATDGTETGKVTVTWNNSDGTLVYEVYRADIPAYLGGNIKKINTVSTNTYDDSTAMSGNRYYYWVKARNSWGISRYSKFDTGYTGNASSPLSAPTNVIATEKILASNVTVTWNAVQGAIIYEVWRATQLPVTGGKPKRVGALDGISFLDTSMVCGTPYYYWVKARDSWGASKYSVYDIGGCGGLMIVP